MLYTAVYSLLELKLIDTESCSIVLKSDQTVQDSQSWALLVPEAAEGIQAGKAQELEPGQPTVLISCRKC